MSGSGSVKCFRWSHLHQCRNLPKGASSDDSQQRSVYPADRGRDPRFVAVLERQLGTNEPEPTARKLEAFYRQGPDSLTWNRGTSAQIAWESHELAESDVYRALGIPVRPCEMDACRRVTRGHVTLSTAYMDREGQVAGHQLADARHRPAALLNQIWSSLRDTP
jgi:hypothetical protein